jgi:hypothetical protein
MAKVMSDPRLADMMNAKNLPFDGKHVLGGVWRRQPVLARRRARSSAGTAHRSEGRSCRIAYVFRLQAPEERRLARDTTDRGARARLLGIAS